MILLIDNFDSFTYNLYDYLQQCGQEVKLYRNNEINCEEAEALQPAGIVFSPGPMSPQQHPLMMQLIERNFQQIPMLGVCLGYQALGQFFGAELVKAPLPTHGKVAVVEHNGHKMFSQIPSTFNVTRYHSLVLQGLENTLFEMNSSTRDGLAMSAAHKELPLWGVQFHPEAVLTEHGLQLLRNWVRLFL